MNPAIALDQFSRQLDLNLDNDFNFETHKKLILWGVRSLGHGSNELYKHTTIENKLSLYHFLTELIDKTTPNQLMTIFPIIKEYDGHKYEMKDYFYTMQKCKEHGLDNEIANSFEFLWDYHNRDVGGFVVNYLSALGDISKREGGQGLMELYLAETGATTYFEKKVNGKKFFVEKLVFNSKGKLI